MLRGRILGWTWRAAWLAAWPVAVFCQLAPADVQILPIGDGKYELTLHTTRATEVAAAQAELMPTAWTVCGAEPAQLGRYTFERLEELISPAGPAELVLRQEVQCGKEIPAVAVAPPAVSDGAARSAIVDRLHEMTRLFFDRQDTGRFDEAYRLMSPGFQKTSPREAWIESRAGFRARSGHQVALEIKKVTWYDNPPDAPAPGVYVAFDYGGRTEHFPVLCGYLIWQQQPSGEFLLGREEFGYLDDTSLASISPMDLPTARANIGCRD